MTPEEAKQKWCPFGRKSDGWNLDIEDGGGPRCIAENCMAWRGVAPYYKQHNDEWVEISGGHCGLAGKP